MLLNRSQRYLTLLGVAGVILSLHLGIRLVFPSPSLFPDLVLYNSTPILTGIAVLLSPLFNDRVATTSLGAAILIWALGSTISTANSFFAFQLAPSLVDICYSLFYPLVLLALVRMMTSQRRLSLIEILDVVIVALGITGVAAGWLLKAAMERFAGSQQTVFLSILYPVGDLLLLAVVIGLFVIQRASVRTSLLLSGVVIFTTTDWTFLIQSAGNGYPFASLVDDGWLLGILLIAAATHFHGGELEIRHRAGDRLTNLALFLSLLTLIMQETNPGFMPRFVLIPVIATLVLAAIRLNLAIQHAKRTNEANRLARTDELTGLPNRRGFMASLELLTRKEGTLLLMDLNGFKQVNDIYGHEMGDQLLRCVALRFSRVMPNGDILARLGGDEFAAIVFGKSEAGIEVAQALHACLSYPIALAKASVDVGVSIGQTFTGHERLTPSELLQRADEAMYRSKRSGDAVVLWQG